MSSSHFHSFLSSHYLLSSFHMHTRTHIHIHILSLSLSVLFRRERENQTNNRPRRIIQLMPVIWNSWRTMKAVGEQFIDFTLNLCQGQSSSLHQKEEESKGTAGAEAALATARASRISEHNLAILRTLQSVALCTVHVNVRTSLSLTPLDLRVKPTPSDVSISGPESNIKSLKFDP